MTTVYETWVIPVAFCCPRKVNKARKRTVGVRGSRRGAGIDKTEEFKLLVAVVGSAVEVKSGGGARGSLELGAAVVADDIGSLQVEQAARSDAKVAFIRKFGGDKLIKVGGGDNDGSEIC